MLQECVSGDAAIGQSRGEATLPTFRGEDPERNPLPAGSCVVSDVGATAFRAAMDEVFLKL